MKPIPPPAPTSSAAQGSYTLHPIKESRRVTQAIWNVIEIRMYTQYTIKYHASPTCTQGHHTGQGTIEGVQKTPWL